MNTLSALTCRAAWLSLCLVLGTIPSFAAATISQQIDPPEINVDQSTSVTITIQNGSVQSLKLPPVEGLQIAGQSTQTGITIINGAMSSSMAVTFALMPTHAGDFTIPAFDVTTTDGTTLHVHEMKLHVLASGAAPSSHAANPAPPGASPAFNPSGAVDTAPANPPAAAPDNGPPMPADSAGAGITPPTDPDGRPAKVFLVIKPETTDAYVGQLIKMRVDFFIRNDVDTQQDSLPTMDGSDFLMNDLSVRPAEQSVLLMNEGYRNDSWVTAIESPKSGDFPLQVEQDTYWVKSLEETLFGPRPITAHANIPSNKLVIHVHPLPTEGRPANFTGAIGQFKVDSDASPKSVDVGDPVKLAFTVTGEGNFSYVQCPALALDPNWKTYTSSSKTEFTDEAHTLGAKSFTQSVIPKKNGALPLPAANFSYFDPMTKQYVTVPVTLPTINVTGSMPVAAAAPPPSADDSAPTPSPTPDTAQFLPNRLAIGTPQASLAPIYQKPWFWAVQGGLAVLLLGGVAMTFFRSASNGEEERAEQARRRRSLHQEENAMSEAVRQGDALTFFVAARHAVQLHLGARWRLNPEAITLAELRARDSQLADALEPFFAQADEIIYSGGSVEGIDLASWEARVREALHQLQPA